MNKIYKKVLEICHTCYTKKLQLFKSSLKQKISKFNKDLVA